MQLNPLDTDAIIAQRKSMQQPRQTEIPPSDYFAAAHTDDIAMELQSKVDDYYTYITSSNLADLWRRSYKAYYGMRQTSSSSGWGVFDVGKLIASGDMGEIVRVKVNHFANLITHQLTTAASSRPAVECRAINSDAESLVAAQLGDGILEYFFRERKIEQNFFRAIETCLVLSEAYIVLGWDSTAGKESQVGPNDSIIYDGDLVAKNFTPFKMIKDVTKNSPSDHKWYISHDKMNKYDCAAKFAANDPDLAQKILSVSSDVNTASNRTGIDPSEIIALSNFGNTETDDIPFMEFYHEPTDAVPDGRYTIFVNGDIKLFDGKLPFREVPVYRVSPKDIIGTSFGWTMAFDILGVQELLDKLYTIISSNVMSSGLQNFWCPPGNGVSMSQLPGGLTLIEAAVKPEVLELLKTPAEVYNYVNKLEQVMETLIGVSAINRGDLPSKDMSGSAMAFLASQTITFSSGLQASANQLIESLGTGMVNILKDFAQTERMAVIAGKQNRPQMKMFSGADLEPINNVVCDSASALSKTIAGRISIADNLLRTPGMIKTPQEYLTLLKTGQMEPLTRGPVMENFLIQQENESLLAGQPVMALRIDDHAQHIAEHKSILSSPASRQDGRLVQNVLAHIQEHENQAQMMQMQDPAFLAATGQPPLPFPALQQAPQPGPVPNQPQGTAPAARAAGIPATENPASAVAQKVAEVREPRQPNLPKGADEKTQAAYEQLQHRGPQ